MENLEETLQRETEDFAENNGFEQTCSFAIEAIVRLKEKGPPAKWPSEADRKAEEREEADREA